MSNDCTFSMFTEAKIYKEQNPNRETTRKEVKVRRREGKSYSFASPRGFAGEFMNEKIYALDMSNEEWAAWLTKELNQPKFRADQICGWIWQKRVFDVEEMTNLSVPLREQLEERVDFGAPVLMQEQRSGIDGTRKYLWQLRDGHTVESVLLRQNDRLTACISTQVGCPLQCTFCATGLSGYVRNLSAGEIAGQFLAMEKSLDREINNVVYMGMGEPFLNTESVLKSVRMLNSPKMRNLGIRHITISTSGIIPGIAALAESGLGVRLAVSLHAADDELRSILMPVNQTFPAAELRKAMQEYQAATGDRITIEYALFGGVNDGVVHARDLVRYLKGIHVFVNLIPFNAVDGRYEKPKTEDILRFRTILTTAGFESEIRSEQGADIDAACGQLRRKTMAGDPCALEPKPHSVTNSDMRYDGGRPRPQRAEQSGNPAQKREYKKRDTGFSSEKREVTKRPSGGFVDERGARHRKTELPEKERYRSGKMKEARPSYRGQGETEPSYMRGADGAENRTDMRREDRPRYDRGGKPEPKDNRYGDKPRYERGEKFAPREDKPRYDRGGKPESKDNRYGDKPRYERGEKFAPREDKPRYDRGGKPESKDNRYGDKPRYERGEKFAPREDKPRYDKDARGGKPSYGKTQKGAKPVRKSGGFSSKKKSGK